MLVFLQVRNNALCGFPVAVLSHTMEPGPSSTKPIQELVADLNVTPPPNVTITHLAESQTTTQVFATYQGEAPSVPYRALHGPSLSTAGSPSSCGEAAAEIPVRSAVPAAGPASQSEDTVT